MYEAQEEAGMSNFSGTNNVFNQNLEKGASRGLYRATTKRNRATIQVTVKNFTPFEQVYELFNSNNSIANQYDDALYQGRAGQAGSSKKAFSPLDQAWLATSLYRLSVDENDTAFAPVGFSTRGNLCYIDMDNMAGTTASFQAVSSALNEGQDPALKISLKSTLGGNTYKRLIEKMKTSVIHISEWKIQCSNEEQFQLSIAQKDYTITGASSDDEYQISASVSSKDNNTKIVEIGDKMLLIDGDTRLSGIILPETTMVFTFEVDIINEVTKRVF